MSSHTVHCPNAQQSSADTGRPPSSALIRIANELAHYLFSAWYFFTSARRSSREWQRVLV